jgi:tRNA(fMet)-specific endonuclease VapC
VIGELHFGALNSQRPRENLQRIRKLVDRCTPLSIHPKTAQAYARIRLQLKRKGKPIPENDLWIAASCLSENLPLATEDAHFLEVDDLVVRTPPPSRP